MAGGVATIDAVEKPFRISVSATANQYFGKVPTHSAPTKYIAIVHTLWMAIRYLMINDLNIQCAEISMIIVHRYFYMIGELIIKGEGSSIT